MSTPSRFTQLLFVELALDGKRHYFEFLPNDDRAVTVGSSPEAQWCVDRHGVSPIAFHLERERDEIHVTPGYGTALRLNSRVVKRRAPLSARAMLEFHDIALQARILRELPADASPTRSTPKPCRSSVLGQALDGATVPVEVRGLHRPPPVLATNGIELGAPRLQSDPDLEHDTEPVQYFMTELIRVVPPEHALPMSIDTQTTAFEAVQPSRVAISSPPSPRVDHLRSTTAAEKLSTPAEKRALAPSRTAWLARLGLLTKAKPLPVLVTTLGVALLFGVLAANGAPLLTSTPASAKASGDEKASAAPRPAAGAQSFVESVAPSAALPPRALVAKVVAPATHAPERGSSPSKADPDLAGAVLALGAGRYAEAARAYSSIAARAPDSKVYRALARLLEKASSADCTPRRPTKPSCPEVHP